MAPRERKRQKTTGSRVRTREKDKFTNLQDER